VLVRIERALKAKQAVHEELLKYGKDGDTYWVELDILPVFDEEGAHTHWVSVQRDITERKLLQEKLVETERLASVGLLAANLASEINNPLAAVSSSLEWLAEQLPSALAAGASPEDGQAILDAIEDARTGTQRMGAATSYLRLLAGADDGAVAPTDVHEVLETAIALLEAAKSVPGKIVRAYGAVPKVSADASRLVHVFHLALRNAVESLTIASVLDNVITIRTRVEPHGVLIAISDTGTGIPVEITGKLFSPFVTTKVRGSAGGLGLFIANRLVREVGGRIHLQTREEGGSLFEVVLPIHAAVAGADA
jgi:C4-dicarboxylate-specific signal transduction histidine kinase